MPAQHLAVDVAEYETKEPDWSQEDGSEIGFDLLRLFIEMVDHAVIGQVVFLHHWGPPFRSPVRPGALATLDEYVYRHYGPRTFIGNLSDVTRRLAPGIWRFKLHLQTTKPLSIRAGL